MENRPTMCIMSITLVTSGPEAYFKRGWRLGGSSNHLTGYEGHTFLSFFEAPLLISSLTLSPPLYSAHKTGKWVNPEQRENLSADRHGTSVCVKSLTCTHAHMSFKNTHIRDTVWVMSDLYTGCMSPGGSGKDLMAALLQSDAEVNPGRILTAMVSGTQSWQLGI